MPAFALTPNLPDGAVVYFHHLHLNEAVLVRESELKVEDRQLLEQEKEALFRVKGKARPMLVIGPSWESIPGVRWYRVLLLTTKGLKPNGKVKPVHRSLGRFLGEQVTYIKYSPYNYPENLICGNVMKTVGKVELDAIMTEVNALALRRPLQ